MAVNIGVSVQTLSFAVFDPAVSPVVRGSSNLNDVMLPLPPGELSLGPEASPLERELVIWANDITSRLQQLLQE